MLRLTRSTVLLSLVWICLFGTRTSAADTIYACVNPAGHVRLVAPGSSCRHEEQRVVWNVQGPQGPEGPQGPAGADGKDGAEGPAGSGPAGVSPATVVDALDTVVGQLVGRNGELLVRVGDERFFVTVGQGGFVKNGRFIHTTAGCTDPGYAIGVNPTALAHLALVSTDTAWVPDLSVAPLTLTAAPGMLLSLHTRLIDATGTIGPCLPAVSSSITLWALKPVDLSTFTAPFRIQ